MSLRFLIAWAVLSLLVYGLYAESAHSPPAKLLAVIFAVIGAGVLLDLLRSRIGSDSFPEGQHHDDDD